MQQEFNVRTRLSAAARSEAEETISKRPKNLLKDFNGTDATVLGVTAAAVPAIAVSILDLEV